MELPEPVPMMSRSWCATARSVLLRSGAVARVEPDHRRRVEPVVAPALQLLVPALDLRGERHVRPDGGGLLQAEQEILAHPVDREAEVELVAHHRVAAV